MRRFSYANVVATFALVVAMSGTAVAASHYLITSSQQVKPGAIALGNISRAARSALHGARGPQGPQGRQGTRGNSGAPGSARAYGEVTAAGTLSNASGNPTITHPRTGRYCLSVRGVDPTTTTVALTVGFASDTNAAPPSESAGDGGTCPVGTWEIAQAVFTSPAGGGNLDYTNSDEPFGFVVP